MEDPPHGDNRDWLLGWQDRFTGERGRCQVTAAHSDEAKRGFERDHPTRVVQNIYEVTNR